jgi:hypothetical protein
MLRLEALVLIVFQKGERNVCGSLSLSTVETVHGFSTIEFIVTTVNKLEGMIAQSVQ